MPSILSLRSFSSRLYRQTCVVKLENASFSLRILSTFVTVIMEYQVFHFPVLFTALIFLFMLKKLWKRSRDPTSNLPPGPRKLPIIGNLHQLIGPPPHRRLRDLAMKHGSVMQLQLGEVSNVVISSAEAAKEVMKTHDLIFASRPSLVTASVITCNYSDIIFAPYGESWRQLRKICVLELLSAKRVQSFRSIREEEVSKFVNEIFAAAGSPFNLSKKLLSLIYVITSRVSFGQKCKDQDEFISRVEEMIKAVAGFSLVDLFPSYKLLHLISGMRNMLQRLAGDAYRIVENIILDHKSARKDISLLGDSEDLVDVLLRLQSQGNLDTPLTDENIKGVVQDIFGAGSETSATTVEWAMSELLKSQRAMRKAQAEVRMVFNKKGTVDESELHELKYLKLVIKETLRLHPPAPLLLPRESRESCEISGYTIPEKTKVIVNAWAIARDPKYWDDPEEFNPERFLDSDVDFKGNNFEFIPFGAGRRQCPGLLFGLAIVELLLAKLLYHFDWKLANGKDTETLDMTEVFGVTVRRKNDLHLIPVPYKPDLLDQLINTPSREASGGV